MDKELTTGSLPIGVLYPGNFLQKKLTNFTANFYTTTNRTVQNKQHHAQYWASLASNGELQRDGNYDGAQAILAATEALCPSIIYLPLFRNNVGKLIPD